MIESVFSTEDVPKADRWASWYETGTKSHLPTLIRTDHQADFHGEIRLLDLGSLQVSTLTYSPLLVTRTPKLIRQSDPGVYFFVLHRHGRLGVAQDGRETLLGQQDLVLYDTSQPFTSWASAEHGGAAGCMVMQVPKKLFPIRPKTLSPLTAVRLPSREGLGALVAHQLTQLVKHAPSYTAADTTRLATITLDILAALCAHELESTGALPADTRRQALQAQIHEFIRQRLGEPALSPGTIAAAHRMSTRHLYKLFQDQGLTVADWIRQCRLERCRRDLADPNLHSRPVHTIAARWGFTSSAHFSRAFRTAYGMPPSEYRHAVASGQSVQASSTTRTDSQGQADNGPACSCLSRSGSDSCPERGGRLP
ncbi:helix-turn-helix domain-containing protein [Streptomyces hirsutus]|uniref:helix-turn-helix domain-containing protein n=1 Tax=Streptomyces hirsutus TaxID=35620 RepID=UPI0033FC9666